MVMAKKGNYWLLFTSILVLLILVGYTVFRLNALGVFVEIQDKPKGNYTVIAEVPGPEALYLDREDGILYFISNNPCEQYGVVGHIYYLQLDDSNQEAHAFALEHPKDFHPHGLSYFRDKRGEKYLFTNNHRKNGSHTVEIFKIVEENLLQHQITITGPELTSPNDLAAVGPKQFYVTNDGRAHDRGTRSIDTFLGRKTGNVLLYDGKKFIKVVDNLYFPNGIAFNSNTNELIVGETLSGRLIIYQWDEVGKIRNVDNFFIGSGIDNIHLDEQGQLLVAVHPNLLALSRHMNNVDKSSPAQVFKVNYKTKGLKLLFQHDGTLISGVSAAVSYQGNLYLGAVCDNKLLKLRIDN